MPARIQLRRTAGWRIPANTVSVARPTLWGNPFPADQVGGAEWAVILHERWLEGEIAGLGDAGFFAMDFWDVRRVAVEQLVERIRRELSGKNLACWCPLDQPCHADTLLKLAND